MLVSICNGGPGQRSGARAVSFAYHRRGNTGRQDCISAAIHRPNDTGRAISCPYDSQRAASIARLHTRFVGRTILCGIVLNFSDVYRTGSYRQ